MLVQKHDQNDQKIAKKANEDNETEENGYDDGNHILERSPIDGFFGYRFVFGKARISNASCGSHVRIHPTMKKRSHIRN